MKPSLATQLLVPSFRNRRQVLLSGPPGVGKSDLVDQAAAAAGARCITRHPAVEDPTDAKGMPAVLPDGKAHFLPFNDLQKLIDADGLTVCHLEDFGQATHAVQAAYMQLLLRRAVNGYALSPHVVFVVSTNRAEDRAGVNTILEPVKSRFQTMIELEVNVDDWVTWAYGADLAPEVIAFIKFRPELLHKPEPSRELTNSPSPRTVANVAKWVADGLCSAQALGSDDGQSVALEVISGAAGKGFAAEFLGFLKVYHTLPSIEQILLDPERAPVPNGADGLFAVSVALAKKLADEKTVRPVFTYATRLPKEFEVCLVRDGLRVNQKVANTKEYGQWALKNAKVVAG